MDYVKNPGGGVAWTTWFELPASHLDELTPGKYTRITLGAITPTNRASRKPYTFCCVEI